MPVETACHHDNFAARVPLMGSDGHRKPGEPTAAWAKADRLEKAAAHEAAIHAIAAERVAAGAPPHEAADAALAASISGMIGERIAVELANVEAMIEAVVEAAIARRFPLAAAVMESLADEPAAKTKAAR